MTLSTQYVHDWGFWEGARELIANAQDAGNQAIETFNDRGERWLSIKSQGGKIPSETLLLGNSTNRSNEDAVGTFGEGYKIALLVLTRMGYTVRIKNGFDRWVVSLEAHPQLHSECLCVDIQEDFYGVEDTQGDVVDITVLGLTEEDDFTLRDNYLYDDFTKYLCTEDVVVDYKGCQVFRYNTNIYPEDRGDLCDEGNPKKVFVNGLFVCDLPDDYCFSYNFTPNKIKLDRDRKSVNTWDMQYEVASLLEDAGAFELMVQMSEERSPDLYKYYTPSKYKRVSSIYSEGNEENVSEALQKLSKEKFIVKHGEDAVAIDTTISLNKRTIVIQRLQRAGKVAVEVPTTYYKMLPDELKAVPEATFDSKKTPTQLVTEFFETNKKHMRSKSQKAMQKLIEDLTLTQ